MNIENLTILGDRTKGEVMCGLFISLNKFFNNGKTNDIIKNKHCYFMIHSHVIYYKKEHYNLINHIDFSDVIERVLKHTHNNRWKIIVNEYNIELYLLDDPMEIAQ